MTTANLRRGILTDTGLHPDDKFLSTCLRITEDMPKPHYPHPCDACPVCQAIWDQCMRERADMVRMYIAEGSQHMLV